MFYNIKGRLADGRTISGVISGQNPVEACATFVTSKELPAADLIEVKLVAINENVTAKVRAPKKKKDTGATEADKLAGANHMANVAAETAAETAAAAPQATAPSPRRR